MPDKPLPALNSPTDTLAHYGISVTSAQIVEVVASVIFLFWLIYTLVAIYHWVHYSHAARVAFPAITLHIVVSIVLLSYAFSFFI